MSTKITFAGIMNVAKITTFTIAVLGTFYGIFFAYYQWRADQVVLQKDVSEMKNQIKNFTTTDNSKDTMVYVLNESLILLNHKIDATNEAARLTNRKVDKVQSVLIDFITSYDPLTKEDLARIMKELYDEGDLKKNMIPYSSQGLTQSEGP